MQPVSASGQPDTLRVNNPWLRLASLLIVVVIYAAVLAPYWLSYFPYEDDSRSCCTVPGKMRRMCPSG